MPDEELLRPYDLMGGADKVRELVDRFYDHMDTAPEYTKIRRMHPPELASSRDKLFMFLSGWLGGPQLYIERYGHPRLRARHLPFAIDSEARDQWLACMDAAMAQTQVDPAMVALLQRQFAKVADFMRNVPD